MPGMVGSDNFIGVRGWRRQPLRLRDEEARYLLVLDQMHALAAHAGGRDCPFIIGWVPDTWQDMLR